PSLRQWFLTQSQYLRGAGNTGGGTGGKPKLFWRVGNPKCAFTFPLHDQLLPGSMPPEQVSQVGLTTISYLRRNGIEHRYPSDFWGPIFHRLPQNFDTSRLRRREGVIRSVEMNRTEIDRVAHGREWTRRGRGRWGDRCCRCARHRLVAISPD